MNFKGIVSYILITARSVTSIRFCARHNSYQRIAQSLYEFVPYSPSFSRIDSHSAERRLEKEEELRIRIQFYQRFINEKNIIQYINYLYIGVYCLESVWEGVLNTNYPSFNPRFRNAFTATNKSLSPITFAIPAEIRRVRCGRRDYGVRRADRSRA